MFRKCFAITIVLLFSVSSIAVAQDSDDDCAALVEQALTAVDDACSELGRNEACYGHNLIVATNFDASALDDFADTGDTIDITQLASLTTAPLKVDEGIWGIALLSLQANLPDTMPGQNVTFVVFGDAELVNEVPPEELITLTAQSTGNVNLRTGPGTGYAAAGMLTTGAEITLTGRNEVGDWASFEFDGAIVWVYVPLLSVEDDLNTLPVVEADNTSIYIAPMQAFQLTSGIGEPACREAPRDGLLVQAPTDTTVYFQINGVEVTVGSTALLLLDENDQLGVNTFDGEVSITSAGETQIVNPGYQVVAAADTAPTEPEPYDYANVKTAPVDLLPEEVTIPRVVPVSFNLHDCDGGTRRVPSNADIEIFISHGGAGFYNSLEDARDANYPGWVSIDGVSYPMSGTGAYGDHVGYHYTVHFHVGYLPDGTYTATGQMSGFPAPRCTVIVGQP